MRRRPIPPYRVLSSESLVMDPSEGWELSARDAITVLPDGAPFPAWDASLSFELRRRFTLGGFAHRDLGVEQGDPIRLQLLVRLGTAGNLRMQTAIRRDLPIFSDAPLEIVVRPEIGTLARDIVLETSVVVVNRVDRLDPLVPNVPGARLWENRWRARLEGGKVRLPMEVLDFDAAFGGLGIADALFHVDVADDADLDFEQGVRVCINGKFTEFVRAVEVLAPIPTAMLWEAVVRRVLVAGIGAGFDPAREYAPASVGAQWRGWFGRAFPGETAASVTRLLVEEPSRFEARIQSWARIYRGVTAGLAT